MLGSQRFKEYLVARDYILTELDIDVIGDLFSMT